MRKENYTETEGRERVNEIMERTLQELREVAENLPSGTFRHQVTHGPTFEVTESLRMFNRDTYKNHPTEWPTDEEPCIGCGSTTPNTHTEKCDFREQVNLVNG